jgi:tol-pal system protein YbgF
MYKVIFLALLAMLPLASFSQVPVVEAGTSRSQTGNTPAEAASGGNDLLLTLYNQLQALQREVQTLRGTVEEQGYQIKRMETEQRNRYLDIDRRLSSGAGSEIGSGAQPLTGNSLPPVANPNAAPAASLPGSAVTPPAVIAPQQDGGIATNTTPAPGTQVAPSTGGPVPPMDEQELYRTALNLLLEQSNYNESIRYFQTYITSYPQGRYLTNAYYWQGEAFILVDRFNDAKNVFSKIISDFPQDPKAAGAMLKLGVVYEAMGEVDQARTTWQQISVRYPESPTEIREAENHLRGQ